MAAHFNDTNSLIVANLAPHLFADEGQPIRESFRCFGKISHISLLPSLKRALIVFESASDAFTAKFEMDNQQMMGTEIRYVNIAEDNGLLHVPDIEKNFLLSPPGSPPVGWTQPREDGPNPGGHAQALLEALRSLPDDGFSLEIESREGDAIKESTAASADFGIFHMGGSQVKAQGTWHHPAVSSAVISSLDPSPQNLRHLLTFGAKPSPEPTRDIDQNENNHLSLPVIVVDDYSHDIHEYHMPNQKSPFPKTSRPPLPTR
ncbi:carbohydrate-binding module 1 protein [Dinochytrium kinnereticum]|nr:carbohydrate-binding module 1 protein [Dinochytrium kinnereticum]